MAKAKKHLSKEEEFDILKLVLDKFLWIGVFIMGFGFYKLLTTADLWMSLLILASGVIVMLLFTWVLFKEYNFMK